MGGQGISQVVVYVVVLIALAYPLGMYMARVFGSLKAPRVPVGDRGRLLQARPHRPEARAGLEELRPLGRRFQPPLLGRAVRDPAAAGAPVPEPGQRAGRPLADRAEHDRQLRHEHELAVLRRRVHDVVPDPDGRPRRPAVRLGGGRHRGARRVRPRCRAALLEGARQLLGRPLPLVHLRAAAARGDPLRDPDLAGRAADLRRRTRPRGRSRARCRRSRAAPSPR